MKIAPASTSSSPASMRSAVVFPEPDGPTSTMNSPSSIARSSESTAGMSEPGYTRVACSKRTSAIVPPCLCKFCADAGLRLAVDAELTQCAERRAEHGRSRGRSELNARTDFAHALAQQLQVVLGEIPRDAAAESHFDVLLREVEPGERRPHERRDLVDQAVDDSAATSSEAAEAKTSGASSRTRRRASV